MSVMLNTALSTGGILLGASDNGGLGAATRSRIKAVAAQAGERIGLDDATVERFEKLRKDLQASGRDSLDLLVGDVSGVDREWMRLYALELKKGLEDLRPAYAGKSSAARQASKVIEAWDAEWTKVQDVLHLHSTAPFPQAAPLVARNFLVAGERDAAFQSSFSLRVTQLPRTIQKALVEASRAVEERDALGVAKAIDFIETWSLSAVSPKFEASTAPALSTLQIALLGDELSKIRAKWNPLAAEMNLERLEKYLARDDLEIGTPVIGRFIFERVALARDAFEGQVEAPSGDVRSAFERRVRGIYAAAAQVQVQAANAVPPASAESRGYTGDAMKLAEMAGADLTREQSLAVWHAAAARGLAEQVGDTLALRVVNAFGESGSTLRLEAALRYPGPLKSVDATEMLRALQTGYLVSLDQLEEAIRGPEVARIRDKALEILAGLVSSEDPANGGAGTDLFRTIGEAKDLRGALPEVLSILRGAFEKRFENSAGFGARIDALNALL